MPGRGHAERALHASWWQAHGAAHARGARAQQAGKLEHEHFSREAKAERSRLRAAMLALRDLDLRPPTVPRLLIRERLQPRSQRRTDLPKVPAE